MKRYIILLLIIALQTSCSDVVDGINDDPNSLTQSTYGSILTGAEVGNIIVQTGESARRSALFAGQYTGIDRQHLGFTQYNVTTSDFDALWYDIYVNAFRNAVVAEQAIIDNNIGPVSQGIAQALQAYIIGTTASLYGDVPYDEAANIENTDPVYEDQPAVYAKVQDRLDEAIANLQMGSGRPVGGAEIYFDGAPAKWIETAYTLKARFYLQTKQYDLALQAAQNGISSFENSMYAPHGDAAENSNLNYQFFAVEVRQADVVVSEFMTSLMQPGSTNPIPANYRGNSKTNETARFYYMFNITSVGVQPNTEDGFAAQTAPAPLVTYQENLLILAEAALRSQGFQAGLDALNDFRAFMNNGGYLTNIDPANLQYDPYVAADFASGGIENTNGLSQEDALLKEILEERYVTLFGLIQPFNDLRRTLNETNVRVPVEPSAGNQLPQRFLYPQTEIDRNENTPTPIPDFFEPTDINS
ncbi:SusD-like starch-binding protein associating with outer membrane [Christiangramia gaetbulicola]|uniref:SusD-like starch-binding protein associating with outer membrane n=1 Tax=Christiangramia gaetbulicola TaxID=703340 RepID=A0A2T6ACA3_9FLAO|nr:SusD/RagB family nutrient-binding outer membrane lipoprotein [Christiangramia gaetbulicola]PTX41449.1 SusD-like starch-binding protein associating with outer membrane [Christiangramia gaetbulicola]